MHPVIFFDELKITTLLCSMIFLLYIWKNRRMLEAAFSDNEDLVFSAGAFTLSVFFVFALVLWLTSIAPVLMLLMQLGILARQLKGLIIKPKRR